MAFKALQLLIWDADFHQCNLTFPLAAVKYIFDRTTAIFSCQQSVLQQPNYNFASTDRYRATCLIGAHTILEDDSKAANIDVDDLLKRCNMSYAVLTPTSSHGGVWVGHKARCVVASRC